MAKQPDDHGWREHVLNNLLRAESTAPAPTSFTPGPANPLPLNCGVPSPPQFDMIEMLPAGAADKLRLLRQQCNDAHDLCVPFQEISEANAAKVAAENRVTKLTAHPHDFGFGLAADDRT